MGVRLNKVLTELNIGLQQAVDFLKQNKEYGEIRDDANVNTKINDRQYEILQKEFGQSKYNKNSQQTWIFPKKGPKTVRCTRIDYNGKECGYVNAEGNSYCVKCGGLLSGRWKKIVVSEADYEKSELKLLQLTDENKKLNESVSNLNNNIVKMIMNGYAPQGYRLISNSEYTTIEELRQTVNRQKRIAEENAISARRQEQRISALTEENKRLLTIIEREEKEIQQLKEGRGYNSVFVGDPKYDLILRNAGVAKLQVVKAVKESLHLGLKEAKDLVDAAPSVLKRKVSRSEAERLKRIIEDAGAVVEIK